MRKEKKILQISDLHLCSKESKKVIDPIIGYINSILPGDANIDFHVADEDVLPRLKSAIETIDPDIVAITGDITAFGDTSSFQTAQEWINSIRHSAQRGIVRDIICTPGNHDALGDHIGSLLDDLLAKNFGFWGNLLFENVVKNKIRKFRQDLRKANLIPQSQRSYRLLQNYEAFLANSGFLRSNTYTEPVNLTVAGIQSVSRKPIWMNQGEVDTTAWTHFHNDINTTPERDSVKIALTHHNPVSMPGSNDSNLDTAYNSMPGGGELLSKAQENGMDIILHGHQHTNGIFAYDFDLKNVGQTYAIACGSSTDSHGATFNLITIENTKRFNLKTYIFDEVKGFTSPDETGMDYELEKVRPDYDVLSVRREIRDFSYMSPEKEASLWDSVHEVGGDFIYISGRRLNAFRNNNFQKVVDLLTEEGKQNKIRILITNPNIIKRLIADLSEQSDTGDSADYWGGKESLEDLLTAINESLQMLENVIEGLDDSCKTRITIHLAHSLLPFGAFTRTPGKEGDGDMGIKLLPLGVMGDCESPVIKLTRRKDRALYDFYLDYLKKLFLKSKRLKDKKYGRWNRGAADLKEDYNGVMSNSKPE